MEEHRDGMKHPMAHDSQTLQPQLVRIILAISALFGFDVWVNDKTQA